jgi:hypothetical protein
MKTRLPTQKQLSIKEIKKMVYLSRVLSLSQNKWPNIDFVYYSYGLYCFNVLHTDNQRNVTTCQY